MGIDQIELLLTYVSYFSNPFQLFSWLQTRFSLSVSPYDPDMMTITAPDAIQASSSSKTGILVNWPYHFFITFLFAQWLSSSLCSVVCPSLLEVSSLSLSSDTLIIAQYL